MQVHYRVLAKKKSLGVKKSKLKQVRGQKKVKGLQIRGTSLWNEQYSHHLRSAGVFHFLGQDFDLEWIQYHIHVNIFQYESNNISFVFQKSCINKEPVCQRLVPMKIIFLLFSNWWEYKKSLTNNILEQKQIKKRSRNLKQRRIFNCQQTISVLRLYWHKCHLLKSFIIPNVICWSPFAISRRSNGGLLRIQCRPLFLWYQS